MLAGRPAPYKLAFFKDFFLFITRTISLRLLNFTITLLLRPLSSDFNLWHASIFCGSTGASVLSKTFNTVFFKSISSILWGILEISIHSLLEYCSFSQHFHSNLVTLSTSLLLTFLETSRSDASFVNLFFNWSRDATEKWSRKLRRNTIMETLLKLWYYWFRNHPRSCFTNNQLQGNDPNKAIRPPASKY